MTARTLAAASFVFLIAGLFAQDARVSFEGDWDFVSANERGKPLPDAMIAEHLMKATRTTMAIWSIKEKKELPASKLDYKILDDKTFDVTQMAANFDKDKKTTSTVTKRGIYELKGDTLKVAWFEDSSAEGRPKNFDGGAGIFTAVLKRKAK